MELLLVVSLVIIGVIFFRWILGVGPLTAACLTVLIGMVVLAAGQVQAAEVAEPTVTAGATLQDSLVSIINQVQSGVSAGVSFLQAEIPDVIRQLLTWKLVEVSFWVVLQTITGIVGIYLITRGILAIHKKFQLEAVKDLEYSKAADLSYRDEGFKDAHAAYKLAKTECEAFNSILITRCIAGSIGILCFIIFISNVVGNVLTILQIYVAPKVWLIEYAHSLVK